MHLVKNKFPERFVEIGVAEQNLATVASGMAAMGKIPFITSYAMFSPGRNWGTIRTTICYNNRNVKIAGSHAGVSVGPDGGTHQAIEDIALMRVIPEWSCLCHAMPLRPKRQPLPRLKWKGLCISAWRVKRHPLLQQNSRPLKSARPKFSLARRKAPGHKVELLLQARLSTRP